MSYDYLINTATVLYVVCYIPELYANYKNKNANIYNIPEKVVIFIGTSFAFAYAIVLNDNALIINYGPILALDIIALWMRIYYAYKNGVNPQVVDQSSASVLPV